MKTFIILIFSIFILVACEPFVKERGNGNMTTEKHTVNDFNELDINGNFEIILQEGSEPGLEIIADENLHKYIEVNTDGEQLDISTAERISSNEGIELHITYTNLSAIELGGAILLTAKNTLSGDYLRLDMSGAGTVDLDLNIKALKASISGAGALKLTGDVVEQNINMSGAGSLDAYELRSKSCKVSISGVGGANIYVTESLDAKVSGVGGISYRGNPADVVTDVSGLGSVDREEGGEMDEI